MRDMHCHILPGVDDGARDLRESLAMLYAARTVGITEIICTPHARDPYFDYNAMWDAYEILLRYTDGFPIYMGFEVNIAKLWELGYEWISRLAFDRTDEFLLELQTRATAEDFKRYERDIYEIQGRGFQVIIAHPERYRAIQQDMSIAQRLVRMGCKLQASTDFVVGGRLGSEKKPAKKMLEAGLYSYLASDAHMVKHYRHYAEAVRKFGHLLS